MAKAKGRSELARLYSPAHWGYALSNPEQAYMAACPVLGRLDAVYGKGTAANWIDIQVSALFGASPKADKGAADGIGIFAETFAAEAGAAKLSELMLFFARYKAGRYDNSYSQFDTRRIGNAYFKEFMPERRFELDRINRKAVAEAIERRRFTPPKGYTSLSWYRELKRRAADGDAEAVRALMPG